jgi:hypothetical protein
MQTFDSINYDVVNPLNCCRLNFFSLSCRHFRLVAAAAGVATNLACV